jgi:hypothetical protein
MGNLRGWLFALISGIIASLLASYIYAGGAVLAIVAFAVIPLGYLVFLLILGFSRLNIRFIYAKWDVLGHATEKLIRPCNSTFCFMTITGRTSLHRAEVEAAIKERGIVGHCEFRFLLLHPESSHLEAFCKNEGSSPEQTREKIINTTRNLLLLAAENNLKIQVRWYRTYPIWRITLIDDSLVHVGYYEKGRKGYEGPCLVCPNSRNGGLFFPFSLVFEQAWQTSANAEVELQNLGHKKIIGT